MVCSPVAWSHVGAVLAELQPVGSLHRISLGKMALWEGPHATPRTEKDHEGAAETKHYEPNAAPIPCAVWREKKGENRWRWEVFLICF